MGSLARRRPSSPAQRRSGNRLSDSDRRWLLAILAVAAVLRVGWALYATESPIDLVVSGDAYAYYYYGQEIAAGHGYLNIATGEATAYYPVGYPAILGGVFWLVHHTPLPDDLPLAGTLLNAVLGTASVGLVFVIARRLFGVSTGLVAAAVVALFPNLVFYTAILHLETAFIFLALAAVAVAVTADWRGGAPSRGRLLAFGAVLGLSSYVRPFSLPFVLGIAVAMAVAGAGWRAVSRAVLWALLPVVVLVTPWAIRNQHALDSPVAYSTNMGDTVCIDRGPGATGTFRFASHSGCAPPDDPEVERNRTSTRKALTFVVHNPGRELRQIVQRARYMVEHDHDALGVAENHGATPFLDDRLRTILSWLADWYFYVVGVLAAVGLPALARRGDRRPERLVVLVALLTLVVLPLGLWGNPRFHVPALPLLAVSAAVPLSRLASRLRSRSVGTARGRADAQPAAAE